MPRIQELCSSYLEYILKSEMARQLGLPLRSLRHTGQIVLQAASLLAETPLNYRTHLSTRISVQGKAPGAEKAEHTRYVCEHFSVHGNIAMDA